VIRQCPSEYITFGPTLDLTDRNNKLEVEIKVKVSLWNWKQSTLSSVTHQAQRSKFTHSVSNSVVR